MKPISIRGKDGKQTKVSVTSALFNMVCSNPKHTQGKKVNIQRQLPNYLNKQKKELELLTGDIRKIGNFLTKVSFDIKKNILVTKFKGKGTTEWIDIKEHGDVFKKDITDKINNLKDYHIVDGKKENY